jgi:Asp-tRNA(Asn)/Glu-tRNA(Gln) amidotransferase A subunit family amidase
MPSCFRRFDEARAGRRSRPALACQAAGRPGGVVKDLFDVEGQTTAAGSASWPMPPPAQPTARPWRGCARAAHLIGRTNMTEFAFSGVGINPHHGTPANAATLALEPSRDSRGLVLGRRGVGGHRRRLHRPGLGHRRLDPHSGRAQRHRRLQEHPAPDADARARSPVDHAGHRCAMTRSVRDAMLLHEVLAARTVARSPAPLAAYRLAVPTHADAGRPGARGGPAFERTLDSPARAGARDRRDRPAALARLAAINATAAFRPPRAGPGTASCWPRHGRCATTRAWRCASGAAQAIGPPTTSTCCTARRPGWRVEVRQVIAATTPAVAHGADGRPAAWRRWWPATRPSSPPTPCCCATQRGELSGRLRAVAALPHPALPVGLMVWHDAPGATTGAVGVAGSKPRCPQPGLSLVRKSPSSAPASSASPPRTNCGRRP